MTVKKRFKYIQTAHAQAIPSGAILLCCIKTQKRDIRSRKGYNKQQNGANGGNSGLNALKQACKVELFTDSAYLHNAFSRAGLNHGGSVTG